MLRLVLQSPWVEIYGIFKVTGNSVMNSQFIMEFAAAVAVVAVTRCGPLFETHLVLISTKCSAKKGEKNI